MFSVQTLIFRATVLFMVSALLSYYSLLAFQSFVKFEDKTAFNLWYLRADFLITLLSLSAFVYFYANEGKVSKWYNYMAFVGVLWLITKLFINTGMLLGEAFRLISFFVDWLHLKLSSSNVAENISMPGRRAFIGQAAVLVASIPFTGLLYGLFKGKYDFKAHKQTLYFDDLPVAFDGFTITQVSDLHLGSFDSVEDVKRGVEMIKELQSDLFVFTGDLVNNYAKEAEPWKNLFSSIKAPFGQYSIMGNHDYGDYAHWESPVDKQDNLKQLHQVHAEMGYKLLLNESVSITKNSDTIKLIGVENWGKPPFAQYGKLEKAIEGVAESDFKILLSHDPSHWEGEILDHPYPFHLTLSGHTHGAQMGIEIPFIKWSPVKYIYKQWAGLYTKDTQHLYVNRGFGFLGYPGRIGIWPEITLITLKKTNK